MAFTTDFRPLALADLRREASFMLTDGWRFVQTHAVSTDDGIDLYYTFMKAGELRNYRIEAVQKTDEVPSITDMFLAAFVFENEARELFGVNMMNIGIDFDGTMYAPAVGDPMTILTPEQAAAREKARKAAAAKASKEASASGSSASKSTSAVDAQAATPTAAAGGRKPFVMTPELQARLDAKMPSLSPEKQKKVEEALAARKAEQDSFTPNVPASNPQARVDANDAGQALQDASKAQKAEDAAFSKGVEDNMLADSQLPIDKGLEDTLAGMPPEKAARVRSALEGHDSPSAADKANPEGSEQPPTEIFADQEMERLLGAMDPERASRVIAAFSDQEEA